MTLKQKKRLATCAVVLSIVLGAVVIRVHRHWYELASELLWKLGAPAAVVLGFLDNHAAAVGAICAVIGVVLQAAFGLRAGSREPR